MPGLHKDLNEMFHDSILNTPLDSEYARVLYMLGLHKILNKILHQRYFIEL